MQKEIPQALSSEVQQQLSLIGRSQWYILVILGTILLSYYTIDLQRQQLVCTARDPEWRGRLPETLPIQAVSSILVILALIFFYHLSKTTLHSAQTPKECHRNQLNHLSSILVLVAALVRFGLLTTGDLNLDD